MFYLIYQITNKLDGKIYIGKHKTNNKDDGYMGSGLLIRRAENKYGIENFEKKILFECQSEEEMNQKEKELVDEEFINRNDTYNINLGGVGSWDYINNNCHNNLKNHRRTGFVQYIDKGINLHAKWMKTLSDEEIKEYCRKISEGLKHYIEENGAIWTGKHHSEETKNKMSKTHQKNHHQQGEKNSNYGKHWWKDPNDRTKCKPFKKGDQIPEGWIPGRWQNMSNQTIENIRNGCKKNIGKIIVTNGIVRIRISKNDPIPEGFYRPCKKKTIKTLDLEIWKKKDHQRRMEIAEKRRQKLMEEKYPIIKEQYLFWLNHSWKEFCKNYNYAYTETNFIQQCKKYLKEEWHPKNACNK